MMLVTNYPPSSSGVDTMICPVSFMQVKISVVGVLVVIQELEKPSSAITYFISSQKKMKLSYTTNTADLRFSQ